MQNNQGKEQAEKYIEEREIFVKGRDGNSISCLYYGRQESGRPLMLDFHGGGFAWGHHYNNRNLCIEVSNLLNINIAAVEYRRGIKAHFPDATYDGYDALSCLCADSNLDFDRDNILLMGHSAGANIAAGMCIMNAQDEQNKTFNIRAQILNYPYLDSYINPRLRPRIGYSIPNLVMRYFNRNYYPDKSVRKQPLASPVYMDRELAAKMPATLLTICGRDNLRVDAISYHRLIKANGVPCRLIDYQNALHGFIEMVPRGLMEKQIYFKKQIIEQQNNHYADFLHDIAGFMEELEDSKNSIS